MGSLLFQELSEDELRAVSLRYFGEQLVGWELLRGGLFNTTYRLDTKDKSVILRLGPVHREVLLPYEQGLMASEPVVQELMLRHGIPTSRTLSLHLDREVLDRDIAVVELIPGVVEDVRKIRENPLVPKYITIYGYIYDVKTGALVEVPAATEVGKAR